MLRRERVDERDDGLARLGRDLRGDLGRTVDDVGVALAFEQRVEDGEDVVELLRADAALGERDERGHDLDLRDASVVQVFRGATRTFSTKSVAMGSEERRTGPTWSSGRAALFLRINRATAPHALSQACRASSSSGLVGPKRGRRALRRPR